MKIQNPTARQLVFQWLCDHYRITNIAYFDNCTYADSLRVRLSLSDSVIQFTRTVGINTDYYIDKNEIAFSDPELYDKIKKIMGEPSK